MKKKNIFQCAVAVSDLLFLTELQIFSFFSPSHSKLVNEAFHKMKYSFYYSSHLSSYFWNRPSLKRNSYSHSVDSIYTLFDVVIAKRKFTHREPWNNSTTPHEPHSSFAGYFFFPFSMLLCLHPPSLLHITVLVWAQYVPKREHSTHLAWFMLPSQPTSANFLANSDSGLSRPG